MKEYILGQRTKDEGQRTSDMKSELHQSDEIGKLYLQEISSKTSHPLQGAGGLTTLLNIFPDKRVYAFHGQMGAGKTTFVKQLCEELGVTDIVNSPTFAIVNVYDLPARKSSHPHGSPTASETSGLVSCSEQSERSFSEAVVNLASEIYHFDCYRIKDLREAYDMGTEEYLYSGNYCFIEWPEMIEDLLPEDTVHVTLTVNDDGTRTMRVEML